jgi:hypothetical protein
MSKPYLPSRVRMWCIWVGVLGICVGASLEYGYRERIARLPALVDQSGHTASLETAMAGLDSYQHARDLRRIGFSALGLGALLCALGVFATSQRVMQDVVARQSDEPSADTTPRRLS